MKSRKQTVKERQARLNLFDAPSPRAVSSDRRGSTLMIVLALLSLLAFTGMVFYTMSSQEAASADYFSESAKNTVILEDDPFPWALRQLIVGPDRFQQQSILGGRRNRHSMLGSVVGYDTVPHSGMGVNIIYDDGLPVTDQNYDLTADTFPSPLANPLNFVDAPGAWLGVSVATGLGLTPNGISTVRNSMPEPDVDHTYPNINNIWLGYDGYGIRDNTPGAAVSGPGRYEKVRITIPSFIRPGLMKSSQVNGFGGQDSPMDVDWYNHVAHPEYAVRSMRPSILHVGGLGASSGNAIARFVHPTSAADAAIRSRIGNFDFAPSIGSDLGKLGPLTGHAENEFELDVDTDNDGRKEAIWMDLGYPVQEAEDGTLYSVLHAITIHDVGGKIDVNMHGNLSRVSRTNSVLGHLSGSPAGGIGGSSTANTSLSASNQSLGPHEVNLIYALQPDSYTAGTVDFNGSGIMDANRLEYANMQMMYMLWGRVDGTEVLDGRWGDPQALYFASNNNWPVNMMPRPGRAGTYEAMSGNANLQFGGRRGYDDNGSALFGVASPVTGRQRGVIHPIDAGGTGRSHASLDPRFPNLAIAGASRPDRYLQYDGFDLTLDDTVTVLNEQKYIGGFDGDISTTADNLLLNFYYNQGMEDPLEQLTDEEFAIQLADSIFGTDETAAMHLTTTADLAKVSSRLESLTDGPFGGSERRRFTSMTNNLRSIPHQHSLGPDLIAGTADDTGGRLWEWHDQDGDGLPEFPPSFNQTNYSALDPFRPEVRVLLRSEAGEPNELITQLPLSINHVLDVNRAGNTPVEGTPAYIAYMRRAGLRFRAITEHPRATDIDPDTGMTFAELIDDSGMVANSIPVTGSADATTALQSFPPRLLRHREFWARRDRQKLARDIYVLLYTLGGGQTNGAGVVENPTADNTPEPGTGVRPVYTDEELRRMAQFAVNMVDAMDADHVVTKFEYDKNLFDGWNLDDDPYTEGPAAPIPAGTPLTIAATGSGMFPLDEDDRGVVMGVEAQQLSFSESLAVRFEDFGKYDGATDDPTTPHNDAQTTAPLSNEDTERRDRYLLHLELQNNQPYAVPLSVNGVTGSIDAEKAIWQIARVDRTTAGSGGVNAPSDAVQAATLDPIDSPSGATADGTTMSFMDGNLDISGGGRFSIAMASMANVDAGNPLRNDPLATGTADLYLQTGGMSYELISPDEPGVPAITGGGNLPHCNLDVIHTSHDGRYLYDENNSNRGHFLRDIPYPANGNGKAYYGNAQFGFDPAEANAEGNEDSGQGFEVVLRRRANPNLPQQPLSLNPWVEVDRIRVEFKDYFNLTSPGGMYVASPKVDQLLSDERHSPLDATDVSNANHGMPNDNRYNTLAFATDQTSGQNNATLANVSASGVAAKFNVWQPHYDREFTSVVELFQLPVVGPKLLTNRLNRMRYSPIQQAEIDPEVPTFTDGDPNLIGSASALFLQPDLYPLQSANPNDPDDNAWHRLLPFVEVPSRVNVMLGDYFGRLRLPGKINLNGISDVEVYAGLIDEPLEADLSYVLNGDTSNDFAPYMYPATVAEPLQEVGVRTNAVTGVTAVYDAGGTASPPGAGGGPPPWAGAGPPPWGGGPPPWAGGPNSPNGAPSLVRVPGGARDRWFEFLAERDGATWMWDADNGQHTTFWIPGTPNARPFRSIGNLRKSEDSILRTMSADLYDGNAATNRHWQELGSATAHSNPPLNVGEEISQQERHYLLQKVANNSTTISNTFVVYITVGYFLSEEVDGVVRIGRRYGLDTDGNGNETDDSGYARRAMFLIDRSELLNAWDEGTRTFDWERLLKFRADLDAP